MASTQQPRTLVYKKPVFTPLWSVAHMIFKAVQVATVGGFAGGYLHSRVVKRAAHDVAFSQGARFATLGFKYVFPVIAAVNLGVLFTNEERDPPRAERLAKHWRQLTVDAFTLCGGFCYPITMRGPPLESIAIGCALATMAYFVVMPILPPYDSKVWIEKRRRLFENLGIDPNKS